MSEIIETTHETYAKRQANSYVDMHFGSIRIRHYFGDKNNYWLITDEGIEKEFDKRHIEKALRKLIHEGIWKD